MPWSRGACPTLGRRKRRPQHEPGRDRPPHRCDPTLASLSFEETTLFYRKLGFEVLHSDIAFLLLHRDGVRLSFWLTGNRRVPPATSCWLEVTGIAALYEAFNALAIVHRRGHLETKPWGTREFSISDCHGNLIRFAERMEDA